MKRFSAIFLAVLLLGCEKITPKPEEENPKPKTCELQEQILDFPGDPKQEGARQMYFKKEYYDDGKPKSLYAIIQGAFGQIDTLEYNFTHSINKIDIILYARGFVSFYNPYPPDTSYFTAYFDPQSSYVTKIGDDPFVYDDNGVLTEAAFNTLEYDNHRNVIFLKAKGVLYPEDAGGIKYVYDLTKNAGKNDLYPPAGLMFGRNYCLAEIMGWIPPLFHNPRTREFLYFGGDYLVSDIFIKEHTYNTDSLLTSFRYDGMTVHNKWKCWDDK